MSVIRCPGCGFLILEAEGCPTCNPSRPAPRRKYKTSGEGESPEELYRTECGGTDPAGASRVEAPAQLTLEQQGRQQ